MIEPNRIYQGDAFDLLTQIDGGSIDLVVTDPPYNIRKAKWDDIPHYVEWCGRWLAECERVLKPTGVMYFFHSELSEIAKLMEWIRLNTRFTYRSFLIWQKPNYMNYIYADRSADRPGVPRRFVNVCEYVLHYTLGSNAAGRSRYTHNIDRDHCNVVRMPAPSGRKLRVHPTQKPEGLIRRLIRVSSAPGDIVLDPFAGSGTTCAAAETEGRRWIGIERDAAFAEIARRRCNR